jgi:hypothetical protein
MTTGRTVGKHTHFAISDGTQMRDIPVTSYGSVGLNYAEQDVTALQEAVSSVLNGQGSFSTTITGPFDNKALATGCTSGNIPVLSGSHTVLSGLNGSQTPRSFGIYVGIQGPWTTGDPVFGAATCAIITGYTVDPAAGTYSAKLALAAGRTQDPSWGTAQLAVSS